MEAIEQNLIDTAKAYNSFFSSQSDLCEYFETESDYAVTLLCGANIDKFLFEILKNTFRSGSKVSKSLLEPGQGRLSEYQLKADLLYALNLLDKYRHRDLMLIGRIRNKFAHKDEPLSLSEGQVFHDLLKPEVVRRSQLQSISGRECFLMIYNQNIGSLLNVLASQIKNKKA